MKLFQKLVTGTVFLSLTQSVFAVSATEGRLSTLEKQMRQIRTENAMGTYGVTTTPCRADIDGYGAYITFGTLYAHPKVGGTEFGYTDDNPAGTLPISGRVKDMDFDWDWGIRAALGVNFEYDNWDANLNYLYFDGDGSRSINSGLNGSIIPLKGNQTIVTGCASADTDYNIAGLAKSQYDVNFHILNFEMGRSYFISGKLAFRPHVGLESAWISLDQLIRYSGGLIADDGLGIHTVKIRDKSDFWGLGPRMGFDGKWFLASGFLVFGNLSGALLYGIFDVDHKEKFSPCALNRLNISANVHKFIPTAQMQLGLGWNKYFNDNKQHIYFRFGYEAQYYWRANQMLNADQTTDAFKYQRISEDVALQGVMLDATVTF